MEFGMGVPRRFRMGGRYDSPALLSLAVCAVADNKEEGNHSDKLNR